VRGAGGEEKIFCAHWMGGGKSFPTMYDMWEKSQKKVQQFHNEKMAGVFSPTFSSFSPSLFF
jgi:hypothetical protein